MCGDRMAVVISAWAEMAAALWITDHLYDCQRFVPSNNVPHLEPWGNSIFGPLSEFHCSWMRRRLGRDRGLTVDNNDEHVKRQC